jgi:hypothetical protein
MLFADFPHSGSAGVVHLKWMLCVMDRDVKLVSMLKSRLGGGTFAVHWHVSD